MAAEKQKKMIEAVNKQIANWTVLHTKLHSFHWNVKGPHFFVLHEKFDELNAEGDGYIDELAERLRELDEKPLATLKEALQVSTIKEAKGSEKADDMVQALVDDFSSMAEELNEAMDFANQAEDQATEDMLLGIQKALDKHIWMLKSYLEQ